MHTRGGSGKRICLNYCTLHDGAPSAPSVEGDGQPLHRIHAHTRAHAPAAQLNVFLAAKRGSGRLLDRVEEPHGPQTDTHQTHAASRRSGTTCSSLTEPRALFAALPFLGPSARAPPKWIHAGKLNRGMEAAIITTSMTANDLFCSACGVEGIR